MLSSSRCTMAVRSSNRCAACKPTTEMAQGMGKVPWRRDADAGEESFRVVLQLCSRAEGRVDDRKCISLHRFAK